MQDNRRSSWSSLRSTLPERKPLMLGWRTPLSRDRSDYVVPVSSITSRSTSLRLVISQATAVSTMEPSCGFSPSGNTGQYEVQKWPKMTNDGRSSMVALTCGFTDFQRRPTTPRTFSQGGSAGSNPVGPGREELSRSPARSVRRCDTSRRSNMTLGEGAWLGMHGQSRHCCSWPPWCR
jgi:hypothetical protein